MEGVTAAERCPQCNHSVFAEDRYCSKCGMKLAGAYRSRRVQERVREAMQDRRVRQVAGGAAIGAAAGLVLPVVTTGLGLVAGAAYAGYKVMKKD
ncbi:hypothetical protein B2G71_18915 [Novosphingobium sp. PC22D]|uniref:hypothetical protein n=1 Tax=Novosphingobium sp. PC22D TaxID=1962403 RepID=UPI000BF1E722|nr:hypothetical protein [Novosphingobium sp. PC22D]PEQ11111.1 hypothetical protein B2G71_18915 [Novosphingobium sp. PC22D]